MMKVSVFNMMLYSLDGIFDDKLIGENDNDDWKEKRMSCKKTFLLIARLTDFLMSRYNHRARFLELILFV
jgi:hypothetical protein